MTRFPLLAAGALAWAMATALAAPAPAQPTPTPPPRPPRGATGQCNDGTYCYNHDKDRACRNHGGVQRWFDPTPGQSNAVPGAAAHLPANPSVNRFEVTLGGAG